VETSSQARRFSAARFILSIFPFLLFGELLKNKIRKLVCPHPVHSLSLSLSLSRSLFLSFSLSPFFLSVRIRSRLTLPLYWYPTSGELNRSIVSESCGMPRKKLYVSSLNYFQ